MQNYLCAAHAAAALGAFRGLLLDRWEHPACLDVAYRLEDANG